MKKRTVLPLTIGILAIVLVVVCLTFLAYASTNTTDNATSHSVRNEFEVQDKATGLSSENANVITNKSASWRLSEMATPFKQMNLPVRNSTPDGKVPEDEWGPGKNAPLASGNRYVAGQCTWYVYNRRMQIGRPIGGLWGNGGSWHIPAAAQGFIVNHTPEVGAVFEMDGHVAFVEEVGLNNSVHISEMNWMYTPFRYNERWVTGADTYWYIH